MYPLIIVVISIIPTAMKYPYSLPSKFTEKIKPPVIITMLTGTNKRLDIIEAKRYNM